MSRLSFILILCGSLLLSGCCTCMFTCVWGSKGKPADATVSPTQTPTDH